MTQTPGFLWTLLFFLLAIGPLIFFHELGHYLVGRWNGVKADVFSIGFGREIAGWTDKRGTRWKVGWLPLGGYVRFAGDMSASSEPSAEWKTLPVAERDMTFQSKALWQRALIVVAGPVTNLAHAAIIFAGIIAAYGMQVTPSVVGAVQPGSAAAKAGFQPGDTLTAVDGRALSSFNDVAQYVELRPMQLMTFDVTRGGKSIEIVAAPAEDRTVDRFGNKGRRGRLGLGSTAPKIVQLPFYEIPGAAIKQTASVLRSMVDGLGQLITGKRSLRELGGPIMIAKYSGQTAAMGFVTFLSFVALISINLGFINLLPIPTLDGGHLFFYAVEGVIRRPVSQTVQEWAFRSGFVLLMGLMLFATFNDLAAFGPWR